MNNVTVTKRSYNLGRRAEAAEATGQRIIDAFADRMAQDWFEDIRLEDVAADAGVTVQTVLRRFGSKDALLEAVCDRMGEVVRARRAAPSDLDSMIDAVIADYEISGDLVMRMLAQDERHPAVRRMTDVGRGGHRAWLAQACEAWLDPADPSRLDAVVVATDVYVWKLIRRDMRRPISELRQLMRRMVDAALQINS